MFPIGPAGPRFPWDRTSPSMPGSPGRPSHTKMHGIASEMLFTKITRQSNYKLINTYVQPLIPSLPDNPALPLWPFAPVLPGSPWGPDRPRCPYGIKLKYLKLLLNKVII